MKIASEEELKSYPDLAYKVALTAITHALQENPEKYLEFNELDQLRIEVFQVLLAEQVNYIIDFIKRYCEREQQR